MVDRTPLRKQLLKAWTKCLEEDYPRRAINSEHGLQAVLYGHLRSSFDACREKYTIFVEPRLNILPEQSMFPDLLICDGQSVIAVIELKYQPRKKKSTRKDLRTLTAIAKCSELLAIQNDRFLGPECDPAIFRLANDSLFVWAGVHRGVTTKIGNCLLTKKSKEASAMLDFEDRFLQLHAVTRPGESPDVFSLPVVPGN